MNTQKEKKIISPIHETLEIEGSLSYSEAQRSWNTIRFKKLLLREFPQLKERREKFGYKMILHRSFKELKKAINVIEKDKVAVPLVVWLVKESRE